MLKLERVSKYYFTGNQVVQALRRVSLECKVGEFIAITGESGSGKSTLLNVMSGLDTYEEGIVYFDGHDISHYSLEELEHYRKDYIGYVFQEFNIIDSYTVYQNVDLALKIQGSSKSDRHRRILALIEQVGLSHVTHQKASRLSGGEKQRTVIARTLAKEYQILMCDEPTGNLNEAAARGIFQLLRAISKDRLVVVVTHDIRLADEYATRKIRLYDGDIVEDAVLAKDGNEDIGDVSPARSKSTFRGTMSVGLQNVVSAPRRTLFMFLTMFFLMMMVLFVYGAGIVEKNREVATENPYFTNATPTRIIVTKRDASVFSPAELALLRAIPEVRAVIENDLVFDSVFTTNIFNEEDLVNEFYDFKPLPAAALDEFDLVAGRLPENAFEAVVGEGGPFSLGDELPVANKYLLMPLQTLGTDQFMFTVVGLIAAPTTSADGLHDLYLSAVGLERIAPSSVFERSEAEFKISGTARFDMTEDAWVTPEIDPDVDSFVRTYAVNFPIWIELDATLAMGEVLAFDMMFFDVCRDFGYKREIRDDFDAGLCDADAFIQTHAISLRANTPYQDGNTYVPITMLSAPATDDDQSQKLYMSEATYRSFFGETDFQVAVIVPSAFEGVTVLERIADLGFEAMYPAEILDSAQALEVLIRNILVTAIIAVILFVLFFVSYFVLHNLVFSKLKDYLIMRSIGAAKSGIKRILRTEIVGIALLGVVCVTGLLLWIETQSVDIRRILGYLRWHDYLIVASVIAIATEGMIVKLARRIFKANVIAALKGAER